MLVDRSIFRHRNIGIIAHVDAGKTTCSERILFYSGAIHKTGEVHHGNTELDYLPEERAKGITITSAVTTVYWSPTRGTSRGVRHRIDLVDTPGHVDFTIEVERSLRVLDGAVVLFDAESGVEPQSEAVWRQAERHGVPRIVFINKMDKVGASFQGCLDSMRDRLGCEPVPVQLPLGEESGHLGIVDLVRMEAVVFDESSKGVQFERRPIPTELVEAARAARGRMIEACAEVDEEVLGAFVEGRTEDLGEEPVERALRAMTLSRKAFPVLCGSAHKNKGIQMLLDAVCAYLPSPADMPSVKGTDPDTGQPTERAPMEDGPLCALVFKVLHLERVGHVTLIRVYSGTLRSGAMIRNVTQGSSERVGRLVFLHGSKATSAEAASAGRIAAVVGMRTTRTGDTLTDLGSPIVLHGLVIPEPVVDLAIEPRTTSDQERLSSALSRMAVEDPSFRVETDAETGQTRIRGMGELHLSIVIERLAREHRVEVNTGEPSVAYRETIARAASAEHRLVKQKGGPGQFACVVLEIEPSETGKGLVFENRCNGAVVSAEFIPAVEAGVRAAMGRGILLGYPMVDVVVRLVDGAMHDVDSRPPAFERAAFLAFCEAARSAEPYVIEPIMEVEVVVPAIFLGEALGDIHGRRGEVVSVVERHGSRVATARVPLRNLFGHVSDLRSRTEGRASATMRLSGYAKVPESTVEKLARGKACR